MQGRDFRVFIGGAKEYIYIYIYVYAVYIKVQGGREISAIIVTDDYLCYKKP